MCNELIVNCTIFQYCLYDSYHYYFHVLVFVSDDEGESLCNELIVNCTLYQCVCVWIYIVCMILFISFMHGCLFQMTKGNY